MAPYVGMAEIQNGGFNASIRVSPYVGMAQKQDGGYIASIGVQTSILISRRGEFYAVVSL